MRRDKSILIAGLLASVGLAAASYLIGLGWVASLSILLASAVLVRGGTYLYFERSQAFKVFEDFRSEKIFHDCIACGACCRLRVNLGKDDAERILTYAKGKRLNDVVIERSRSRYWLKRNSGRCYFLTYSGETPRCQIYHIRPVACRLYPLIPVGDRLKADPLCPGFNKEKGQTFKRYLRTQDVGAYIKKVMGKI